MVFCNSLLQVLEWQVGLEDDEHYERNDGNHERHEEEGVRREYWERPDERD